MSALGLLPAELAGLGWSGRVVWRLRRFGPRRPRRRRVAVGGLLALTLDAFVLWLFIVHVPEQFDADLAVNQRAQPDLALLLVPTLVLAAVWGLLRTLLLAWAWLHRRHRPPSDEGSRTTLAGEEAAT